MRREYARAAASLLALSCLLASCSSREIKGAKPVMAGCAKTLTKAQLESLDPVADQIEHAAGRQFKPLKAADLGLVEKAKSSAEKLEADIPGVVFTSGRRTVDEQADAMAKNVVQQRDWIKSTYKQSTERDALQAWVDQNPDATGQSDIAAGLKSIMDTWTDAQKDNLSKHFSGLAFDVQPSDQQTKDEMASLPNCAHFFTQEGGLTIWHEDFTMK